MHHYRVIFAITYKLSIIDVTYVLLSTSSNLLPNLKKGILNNLVELWCSEVCNNQGIRPYKQVIKRGQTALGSYSVPLRGVYGAVDFFGSHYHPWKCPLTSLFPSA